MDAVIKLLADSVRGIRTDVISASMIENIRISYFGEMTPIKYVGITTKDQYRIYVEPYDSNLIGTITQALVDAGFNAYPYSKTKVVVSVPAPTIEDRKKIATHLKSMGEESKISIRNIRKKWRNSLSKDELMKQEREVQAATDEYIGKIDKIIESRL